MMVNRVFTFILLIVIEFNLFGCHGKKNIQKSENPLGNVKMASWLEGTWESKTSRGSVYESREVKNSGEMKGKGYYLKEGDTVILEFLTIKSINDRLVYIPVVKGQNSGKPVIFSSTTLTEDSLVFENQEHDFPQKILYFRSGPENLVAKISGVRKGKEESREFYMKRIKKH